MAGDLKELKAVLEGNAEFAKNLYTVLSRSPGNVVFSPLSIHAILSLTHQGARGHTREIFSKALNIPDERAAALGYKDVMTRLNKAEDVILHVANKIFLEETSELQDSFKSVAEDHFLSEVDLLNFGDAETAVRSINTWVENKTNNKIKDVFSPDSVSKDTALVLVNAVYFSSQWWLQFNAALTRTTVFYLNDNNTIDVQMMTMDDTKFNYKYDKELDAQIVELDYVNKDFSMFIILPKERNGIAKLERKLANTDLTKITDNLSSVELQLALPKFKIEQTIDLQHALTQLGLGEIFTEDADLSGLIKSPRPLHISKAIQKTFIEINEEGTEAGACTGYPFPCCMPTADVFLVDHPFVIIITANLENSKSFLFQGRVSEPSI